MSTSGDHSTSSRLSLASFQKRRREYLKKLEQIKQQVADAESPPIPESSATTTSTAEKQQSSISTRKNLLRQPSWIRDAMDQGGMTEESLSAMLGMEQEQVFNDRDPTELSHQFHQKEEAEEIKEVVEQYRILAHLQARKMFQEKTGHDLEPYLQQLREIRASRMSAEASHSPPERLNMYEKIVQVPPPPKFWTVDKDFMENVLDVRHDETHQTTLPPLHFSKSKLCRPNHTSELVKGSLATPSSRLLKGELLVHVTCTGCRQHMQVGCEAWLVVCPTCNAVTANMATAAPTAKR